MFRIIGGVVVYGLAIVGATNLVNRCMNGIGSKKSRDGSAKNDAEANAVGGGGGTA